MDVALERSFTPQVSGLCLALFSIFINDLDKDTDGLVIKYVGDTKLDEIAKHWTAELQCKKGSTD